MPKKQRTAQKKARALVNSTEVPYIVALRLSVREASEEAPAQRGEATEAVQVRVVVASPFAEAMKSMRLVSTSPMQEALKSMRLQTQSPIAEAMK
ncbi:hypothetical protein, partial [Streptomyces sp. NPDC007984]|uniref:hypothetical protein n=1 Tax=Streptomyces sp. NPDC007984 TaxID=3364801 RepID=UPI0036DFDB97